MTKAEKVERFHRDNIAIAAEQLFTQNGIEKTTMDHISKEADYSKSTIYAYFKNKDEIVLYLVLKGMKEINVSISSIIDKKCTEVEKYNKICKLLSEMYDQSPFIFNRMLDTIDVDKDKREELPILEDIYQEGESITEKIVKLLQSGENTGEFSVKGDYSQVGFVFWMMLAGIIMLSDKKENYINLRFGKGKKEFLDDSFKVLLNIIK